MNNIRHLVSAREYETLFLSCVSKPINHTFCVYIYTTLTCFANALITQEKETKTKHTKTSCQLCIYIYRAFGMEWKSSAFQSHFSAIPKSKSGIFLARPPKYAIVSVFVH